VAVLKYYNTATSAWEYIAASTTANFTSWKKTMAGGETSVSGTDDNAVTLSYTVGLEQVFINGVLQVRGSDYTATNGTSVTGLTALVAGDIVTVVCYAPFNVANTIAPTLVDAKGDLLVGTGADAVGRLAVGTNGQMLVADSTASAGVKWATAGKILQVVSTVKTNTFSASTNNTFTDVTDLSASITPSSSSNKILIFASIQGGATANGIGLIRLVRNSTAISVGDSAGSRNLASTGIDTNNASADLILAGNIMHLDSPATTSSTTYKIQVNTGDTGGTIYVNRSSSDTDSLYIGRYASNIILMEVSA